MDKSSERKKPEQNMAVHTFKSLQGTASRITNEVYNSNLQAHKLTSSQYGVLENLYKLGTLYQCDLAREINKTTGNITMVIDNLEKRKMVRRVRKKEDRRYFQVVLTKKGEEVIQDLYPIHVKKVKAAMKKLSPAEQQEIVRLCASLTEE